MTAADLLLRAQSLRAQRTPFVLATVVRAQKPTSAKAGDRALVLPDGTLDGFVGGTCAESTVRMEGLRLLTTGESTLLRITPSPASDEDGVVTVTNPCLSGGALDIFMEAMIPATLLYVFGDAPVARALARVGEAAGYDMVATTDPAQAVPADAGAVVVASHGRDEEAVLAAAVRAGVPYVALVASRKRGAAVLADAGLTADQVRTPAGLDIGARSAPDVAVSILAEIIGTRTRVAPAPAQLAPPVASALDPVCGMAVAVSASSLQAEHDGRTWYFCGTGCRDAFVDDPGRYGA
ncbi:XdhC family protein [Virgisporangium ochraceum]|uniref:Carbon monoxide dehydrogenase F protein n=1 Tax=Virgisporangium ochraceum TaxID=65505 RepID=A0A8J3ZU32_9ACTN|nr:XdhC family protein [Virgisporangium ochraceum]GIJ69108.1 carbon monoxide dehydrogenase F protein [Virgisporangium ochraceum]